VTGVDRNDLNRPTILRVPSWGPDGYSIRMAVRNFLFAQPANAALTGVGVRPAPKGSATEGTKSNTWLPLQQQFRSAVGRVADPAIKNVPTTAQFPDASAPGIPSWAIEWSRHQLAGR
jgi:hypothetical protein